MKKTKRIELRVTETTYIEMLDTAIEKGMSMSEYMRFTSASRALEGVLITSPKPIKGLLSK